MIALLTVLLAVTVSGCQHVEGILGGTVLLSCPCSDRDTTQEMKWQMDERFVVFKNVNNVSKFDKSYEGRARVLLEGDCSLILTSIKKEDRGKYRCICRIDGTYNASCVHLTVVAQFTVCQSSKTVISKEDKNEKVFHCAVSGHDKEAKIQWYSEGQQLRNSSETTITHTHTLDTVKGLHSFRSNLMTRLNISKPKCDVKSEDIQTSITENCNSDPALFVQSNQERSRYIIIIPFVTAAGLCVVLCWWKL